jgi:hypothetical protein
LDGELWFIFAGFFFEVFFIPDINFFGV